MLAFTLGALLPLLTILLVPTDLRVPATMSAVTAALALTGWLSARFGYGSVRAAVLRNVAGGLIAMAITFAIGSALGTQL